MKNKLIAGIALATALVGGAAVPLGGAQASSLVTNGSFENTAGFVDNTGGDAMLLSAGATTMTDWTVIGGGTVLWAGPTSSSYMGGLSASDQQYFLDLTGLTNLCPPGGTTCAGVEQTINTTLGVQYKLSFDLGSRGDSIPVSILATAGATSQTFTTSAVWATETLFFTGTGGPTLISLFGSFAGGSGLDLGLDNVSVTATPLPAALPLFASGLGVILLGWRRKRKALAA